MDMWVEGNILMTRSGLFFACTDDRALEINNGGGFLEKSDFDDKLQLKQHPWRSWSIEKVYTKVELKK